MKKVFEWLLTIVGIILIGPLVWHLFGPVIQDDLGFFILLCIVIGLLVHNTTASNQDRKDPYKKGP